MKEWTTEQTDSQDIIDEALQAAWENGTLEGEEHGDPSKTELRSLDGEAVIKVLEANGYMVRKPLQPTETSERGFLQGDRVRTAYGAEVRFVESSSAEGPHIWLFAEQPELGPSPPYLEPFDASCHMTLEQAKQIHDNLGGMIEAVAGRWGEEDSE